MTTQRLLFASLVLLAAARSLLAQETPPPPAESALKTLQAKAELTDEDRNQVRTFVTQRVGAIVSKDPESSRQACDDLRAAYDAGTEGFKRAYAGVALEAMGPAVRKAELEPATRLLTLINSLNTVEAVPLLLEALQDERVGIRAAGAVGLRALREKIAAAGRDTYQRVINGLKEAGKGEKSRDALRTIYSALDYSAIGNTPDAKLNVAAVLELLEERAREYGAGDARGQGADDEGLRVAEALSKNMDEAERKRLIAVIGSFVKYAIEQYTLGERLANVRDKTAWREQIELRNGMERLVLVGENLLTTLLKPQAAPAVAENMRRMKLLEMRTEWKKWVPVLQRETGQDFTITELPEAAAATPETRPAAKAPTKTKS